MKQGGEGFIALPQGKQCHKCPRTCNLKNQLYCDQCADSYALSKTCVTCGKKGVLVHRPMNMIMKYCPDHHEEMVASLLKVNHYQKKVNEDLTKDIEALKQKRDRDTEQLELLEEDLRRTRRERDRAQQEADEARMEADVTKRVMTGFIKSPVQRSPSPVRRDRDRDRDRNNTGHNSYKRGRY